MKVVYRDIEIDDSMYVYVYNYVHSISCMCVWLADCWLWYNLFMCMISCMIRPPCEITDQLAVGTQNCFSTLFYTPYINIKTSAQNAPKCIIARQKKSKKILGRGHSSFPIPLPTGEVILPPQIPPPRRLDSRAFGAQPQRSRSF